MHLSTDDPSWAAHLLALEMRLLSPEVRGQADLLAALLTDEFREFGSSGRVYGKADLLALLPERPPVAGTLSEFRAEALGPDAALVTYTARLDGVESLRSSVWVLREGSWRLHFHQGTRTHR